MLFETGSKILFMGDSITDAGRTQPVGEGLFGPYGTGWVNQVAGLLGESYPERRLRLVNMGTSGHTVRDLAERWDRDVFQQKPDWVVVMIGTNDVWRQFDLPLQPEIHVLPDEYRATLDRLVVETLPRVRGMVLLTPFYLEPNRTDAMRATMDRYGEIVRETAHHHGTRFADTQAAMAPLLAAYHSSYISWDRVHPSAIGHMAITRAFLDAVDFHWGGEK